MRWRRAHIFGTHWKPGKEGFGCCAALPGFSGIRRSRLAWGRIVHRQLELRHPLREPSNQNDASHDRQHREVSTTTQRPPAVTPIARMARGSEPTATFFLVKHAVRSPRSAWIRRSIRLDPFAAAGTRPGTSARSLARIRRETLSREIHWGVDGERFVRL